MRSISCAATVAALLMEGVAMAGTSEIPACLQAAIAPEKLKSHTPPVALYEIVLDGRQLYRLEKDLSQLRFVRAPDVAALDADCKAVFTLPGREYWRRARITRILWTNEGGKYANSFANQKKLQVEAAQKWLKASIYGYFARDGQGMEKITTPQYHAYKTDAMNVNTGAPDSLSLDAFSRKWQGQFDTTKAGVGEGFLISGQDWSSIKIERCELAVIEDEDGFWFEVVLLDAVFKADYSIRVLVRRNGAHYRIADVQSSLE